MLMAMSSYAIGLLPPLTGSLCALVTPLWRKSHVTRRVIASRGCSCVTLTTAFDTLLPHAKVRTTDTKRKIIVFSMLFTLLFTLKLFEVSLEVLSRSAIFDGGFPRSSLASTICFFLLLISALGLIHFWTLGSFTLHLCTSCLFGGDDASESITFTYLGDLVSFGFLVDHYYRKGDFWCFPESLDERVLETFCPYTYKEDTKTHVVSHSHFSLLKMNSPSKILTPNIRSPSKRARGAPISPDAATKATVAVSVGPKRSLIHANLEIISLKAGIVLLPDHSFIGNNGCGVVVVQGPFAKISQHLLDNPTFRLNEMVVLPIPDDIPLNEVWKDIGIRNLDDDQTHLFKALKPENIHQALASSLQERVGCSPQEADALIGNVRCSSSWNTAFATIAFMENAKFFLSPNVLQLKGEGDVSINASCFLSVPDGRSKTVSQNCLRVEQVPLGVPMQWVADQLQDALPASLLPHLGWANAHMSEKRFQTMRTLNVPLSCDPVAIPQLPPLNVKVSDDNYRNVILHLFLVDAEGKVIKAKVEVVKKNHLPTLPAAKQLAKPPRAIVSSFSPVARVQKATLHMPPPASPTSPPPSPTAGAEARQASPPKDADMKVD